MNPQRTLGHSLVGGILSALFPGLGHFVRGYPINGVITVATGAVLGMGVWGLWTAMGPGAAMFLGILLIPPWWCLQTYEASLPSPSGLRTTLRLIFQRAHDIRYLGGLFFVTAFMDSYIIMANPEYHLTVFCAKPAGIIGLLAKVQSPILHSLIGYGFLRLRRWAFLAYLTYAGFGLLNATANYACFGYGRIRTVFFLSLIGFTIYVIWRRHCFSPTNTSWAAGNAT